MIEAAPTTARRMHPGQHPPRGPRAPSATARGKAPISIIRVRHGRPCRSAESGDRSGGSFAHTGVRRLLKVMAAPAHMRPDAQSAPSVTPGMRCRRARRPSHRQSQRRPPPRQHLPPGYDRTGPRRCAGKSDRVQPGSSYRAGPARGAHRPAGRIAVCHAARSQPYPSSLSVGNLWGAWLHRYQPLPYPRAFTQARCPITWLPR